MSGSLRNPKFKTDRLTLRTLRPGDEEFLAMLDADPTVMSYIHAGALSERDAKRWAEMQVEMAPNRWHFHKWMVETRDTKTRIGWVELSKFRGEFDRRQPSINDDISLGYEFAPAHWGQGFAVEAIQPVLHHSFDRLELERVVAFVRPENVRSVRVLEKLEFQKLAGGKYMDEGKQKCLLYSLKKQ